MQPFAEHFTDQVNGKGHANGCKLPEKSAVLTCSAAENHAFTNEEAFNSLFGFEDIA